MKTWSVLILVALSLCCGPAFSDGGKDDARKSRKDRRGRSYEDEGKHRRGKRRSAPSRAQRPDDESFSYFQERGYTRLNIPKGHYPPPGQCRIWYPERPAGRQPPPGRCDRLTAQVPPGAWLIRRPRSDPGRVHVLVYEEEPPPLPPRPVSVPGAPPTAAVAVRSEMRQPRVLVTGEFAIGTGSFVRIVVDR